MAYGDVRNLNREQRGIIKELIRQGRAYGHARGWDKHERRKAIDTAIAVGYTESRWRNLPGGDRDSQGWRQERAMYYKDPRNLKASIRRFYQEYDKDANKRAPLGVRAQQVQQSGTPHVWDSIAPLAERIRREFSGSAGGAVSGRGGSPGVPASVSVSRPLAEPGGQGVAALLTALKDRKPAPVQSAGLPAPAFSAQATLPQGYQPVQSSGGGGERGPSLSELLALVPPGEGVTKGTLNVTPGTPGRSGGGGRPGKDGIPRGKPASGVGTFEGKKVAKWIVPYLQYGRKHGWKGTVTSGYRSFADQQRIYNSGVRPAAKPGTSNHEGVVFPRGAVDVSDAQTLARILRRRGTKKLQYAGAKDPVHFSYPHGGSY